LGRPYFSARQSCEAFSLSVAKACFQLSSKPPTQVPQISQFRGLWTSSSGLQRNPS